MSRRDRILEKFPTEINPSFPLQPWLPLLANSHALKSETLFRVFNTQVHSYDSTTSNNVLEQKTEWKLILNRVDNDRTLTRLVKFQIGLHSKDLNTRKIALIKKGDSESLLLTFTDILNESRMLR